MYGEERSAAVSHAKSNFSSQNLATGRNRPIFTCFLTEYYEQQIGNCQIND